MIFYEQGYILKTTSIVTILNPSDEAPTEQEVGFDVLDLSATIPAEAALIGARWNWGSTAPSSPSFTRGIGSTDSTKLLVFKNQTSATQMAALNTEGEIEYTYDIPVSIPAPAEFAVLWYQERQNQFVLNTGVGVGTTANAVIG